VTISLPGTDGKPRPALVIQSDLFDAHPSVTVLPVTSELRAVSEVMVDKAHTVAREKVGSRIGRLEDEAMMAVNRALATFLGFALSFDRCSLE
jgi:mRNA interferase MazF